MATSVFQSSSSPTAAWVTGEPTRLSQFGFASTYLQGTKLFFSTKRSITQNRRRVTSAYDKSLKNVPKQFWGENLKDGLMENYKNFPKNLYGLPPPELDLFMDEHNPYQKLAESVPEDSLSFARSCVDNSKNLSAYKGSPPRYSMWDGTIYHDEEDDEDNPPDLPSLLLDSRIVYLGLPIVPEVTELILAQMMWLDYDDSDEPIYLYLNCTGTKNENNELIGPDTDAYAIADMISYVEADVYTINVGFAAGQAGMLLSLGKKGKRGVVKHSFTKLYLPKTYESSGQASYIWTLGRELDVATDTYLELLEQGTGKSKEEIYRDIQFGRHFGPQEAIDYGLADILLEKKHMRPTPRDLQ